MVHINLSVSKYKTVQSLSHSRHKINVSNCYNYYLQSFIKYIILLYIISIIKDSILHDFPLYIYPR